jgi:hypothetical protein
VGLVAGHVCTPRSTKSSQLERLMEVSFTLFA